MAESRRVQMTGLSRSFPVSTLRGKPDFLPKLTTSVFPSAAPMQSNLHASMQPDQTEQTVRLCLTLSESDDYNFPEISYAEHNGRLSVVDGGPPVEDGGDVEEHAALARTFQERDGRPKRERKDRIQDLIDIGYGYKEDSFIDNSEAYDEFVPASLTTTHGAFYVNSGPLLFRQASDSETEGWITERETLSPPQKRKFKKGLNKPKKRHRQEVGQMKITDDSKMGTLSEVGVEKKVKKKSGPLIVTNMLRKFRREKEMERQKMEKQEAVPIMPLCPADPAGGGGLGLSDPLLSLIGLTNDHALIQAASAMDIDIDFDCLLDATEEDSQSTCLPQPHMQFIPPSQIKLDVKTQSTVLPQMQLESKTQANSQANPQPVLTQIQSEPKPASLHLPLPLPEGLPPALEKIIGELTMVAKASEQESKHKFFTPEINSLILKIELQCQELSGQVRSKVYTHLSSFLPCSKETLLKRAKKLLKAYMENPMQKLKEAIGRAMSEQVALYLEDCQAHAQVKLSKAPEEGKERDQGMDAGSEDEGEERSGKRSPRKKFKWNEEIRGYLCHVVREQMDRFEMERSEGQEMEEYLKTFLANEIKPFWPKGWMQLRLLLNESRRMLATLDSLSVKKARAVKQHSHPVSSMGKKLDGFRPVAIKEESMDVEVCAPTPLVTGRQPNVKKARAVKRHLPPVRSMGKKLDGFRPVAIKEESVDMEVCSPTLLVTGRQPDVKARAAKQLSPPVRSMGKKLNDFRPVTIKEESVVVCSPTPLVTGTQPELLLNASRRILGTSASLPVKKARAAKQRLPPVRSMGKKLDDFGPVAVKEESVEVCSPTPLVTGRQPELLLNESRRILSTSASLPVKKARAVKQHLPTVRSMGKKLDGFRSVAIKEESVDMEVCSPTPLVTGIQPEYSTISAPTTGTHSLLDLISRSKLCQGNNLVGIQLPTSSWQQL